MYCCEVCCLYHYDWLRNALSERAAKEHDISIKVTTRGCWMKPFVVIVTSPCVLTAIALVLIYCKHSRMPGCALSDRQKKMKICEAVEERLAKAVEVYHMELLKEPQVQRGLCIIAELHGVDHNTLSHTVNNKRNIDEVNAKKQKLTVAEECVLVHFILKSTDRGFPLTHWSIESYANSILQQRIGSTYQPVGKNWIHTFLDQNWHNLKTHWSKPLDMQRAQALNLEVVKHWFDLVEELVVKVGIRRENIYGMDESGFPSADQGKTHVVGVWGTKTQHKQGGVDCENTTALVTICADGTSLRPTIVFKGKGFKEAWFQDNVLEASWVILWSLTMGYSYYQSQDLPFHKRVDRWWYCVAMAHQGLWWADPWEGTGPNSCTDPQWP